MGKTLIDLPEEELQQAMQYSGAQTKKAAVVEALRDYNRRRAMQEYLALLEGGALEGHEEDGEAKKTA